MDIYLYVYAYTNLHLFVYVYPAITLSVHTCIYQFEVSMKIWGLLSQDLSRGRQLLYSSLDPHQESVCTTPGTVWVGPLKYSLIRSYWLSQIQWPVISFWSFNIFHIYWLDPGWDNGSIERASQQWCVFLCTCLKCITHSNRRIATYGVALYSWLEGMYVRYVTDQSCLYMCIEFMLYEQGGA